MPQGAIGEIRMFAGVYAPNDWLLCQGQVLKISDYKDLYGSIKTIYGGDGKTSFALPDLRGRIPICCGAGSGLSEHELGEEGGVEEFALDTEHLPTHTHRLQASSDQTDSSDPAGRVLSDVSPNKYYEDYTKDEVVSQFPDDIVKPYGGGKSHSNMMPSLCINFIIRFK